MNNPYKDHTWEELLFAKNDIEIGLSTSDLLYVYRLVKEEIAERMKADSSLELPSDD